MPETETSPKTCRFQNMWLNSFEEKRTYMTIFRFSKEILLPSAVCAALCCSLQGMAASSVCSDTTGRNLNEVEVVADRVRADVTGSVPSYNLDKERMREIGVTDLTDALHRLPGLNIRDYGGAGGMKTVSVRGFGATHTGVVYDGVALSDCQNGQIDLSRFSLDNVGDLSLIVGDNSDIFIPAKTAASAASIVIRTLSLPAPADTRLHLTGQLKVGSFGYVSPYLRVGKSFSDHFSFSATAEYTHAKNNYPFTLKNGKYETRERRENSMMNSGHGELSARWSFSPSSTLDAKLYYYDNDRQLPGQVVLYNPVCHETLRDRNFFGQLEYANLSLGKFSIRGVAKFNWDASLYHDEGGKYPGGSLDEHYFQREMYLSGAALYMPDDLWQFSYAADWFYNNMSTNQPQQVAPSRHSVLQTLAGKFRNSWLLVTGRLLWSIYDNEVRSGEAAADENRLSPSVSLSVQPVRGRLFFLRASYKNIFRMPTFNDCYYYHLGSTELRPEITDQFNIGVTWQSQRLPWRGTLSATCDVYYNNVKDKIVAIPQNMFIWSMTNLGKVRAIGVDLALRASFGLGRKQELAFDGTYSFQRVQPRTSPLDADYNKQVAYTPVHSGALSLTWKNPWVDVAFHATGASDRYGTNANLPVSRIKGYVDCGAALMRTFRFRGHSLDLRFDLMNMFDTQYEVVASYPMPGINWRVTAAFNF